MTGRLACRHAQIMDVAACLQLLETVCQADGPVRAGAVAEKAVVQNGAARIDGRMKYGKRRAFRQSCMAGARGRIGEPDCHSRLPTPCRLAAAETVAKLLKPVSICYQLL
jgi:hypothetical protein